MNQSTAAGLFNIGGKDVEEEIVLCAQEKEEQGKYILDPMVGTTSPYKDYTGSAGGGIWLVGRSTVMLGPIPRGVYYISAPNCWSGLDEVRGPHHDTLEKDSQVSEYG